LTPLKSSHLFFCNSCDTIHFGRIVVFYYYKESRRIARFGFFLNILVEGHTEDVGADDANLKLSKQRAEAVVQVIVAQGIAQQRLSAAGFGEKRPIADNKTDKRNERSGRTSSQGG